MNFFASLDKRRVTTALVTLILAFLCGFLMQTVLVDETPVAVTKDAPDAAKGLKNEPPPLPVPPAATLVPILQKPPVMPDRADEARAPDLAKPGCTPTLAVEPAPAATLRISLYAPCHPEKRVALKQGQLSATLRTDQSGKLEVRLPALSSDPVIEAVVSGQTMSADTNVPNASDYRHVAVQWTGTQALHIHAYEFGAQKAGFGHVWSGSPKSPSRATRGSGGFLTLFGDGSGPMAEIYSFPAGRGSHHGVVRLVVDAKVTNANCGESVLAKALQSGPLGEIRSTDVVLAMPDCERVGHIVRLQNLLQDMRLAER